MKSSCVSVCQSKSSYVSLQDLLPNGDKNEDERCGSQPLLKRFEISHLNWLWMSSKTTSANQVKVPALGCGPYWTRSFQSTDWESSIWGMYNTFPLCLYGNSIVYWLMVGTLFSISGLLFGQPYKEVGRVGEGTVSPFTFLSVLWALILSPLLRKPPDMTIKLPMSSLSPVLPTSCVALLQDSTVYLVVCYSVGNQTQSFVRQVPCHWAT